MSRNYMTYIMERKVFLTWFLIEQQFLKNEVYNWILLEVPKEFGKMDEYETNTKNVLFSYQQPVGENGVKLQKPKN